MWRLTVCTLAVVCWLAPAPGCGAQATRSLTPEILEQGQWFMHWSSGRYIAFTRGEGSARRFEVWSEGEEENSKVCEGAYVLEGGAVRFLADPEATRSLQSDPSYFEQKAVLVLDEESLEYAEYLEMRPAGQQFFNRAAAVEAGGERMRGGVPIVVMRRYGKVTGSLRVREGPSVSAQPVKLPLYGNETVYPAGTRVFVIARTREKQQVGDWLNYWYLVPVAEHVMSPLDSVANAKWVFAEFVELE